MLTASNELLKEKFITYLQDIYFMESKFFSTYTWYAEKLSYFGEWPEFNEKFLSYRETFRPHMLRLEERVKFYGITPNAVIPEPYFDNMISWFAKVEPKTFAEFITTFYMIEQFKIAAYRWLYTLAYAFGDKETLNLVEWNLKENFEIERWFFERLPEVYLYSLKYENVPFSANVWDFIREHEFVSPVSTYPVPTPAHN